MSNNDNAHQLKIKALQERLSVISTEFRKDLSTKVRQEKQDYILHEKKFSPAPSLVQQKQHTGLETKPPSVQEQVVDKDITYQDVRTDKPLVAFDQITKSGKPFWEPWRYIPRENLELLKKKTLGHMLSKKWPPRNH